MHTRLAPATRPTQPSAVTDEARSIEVLRNVMVHEERFAKVHAAEALIELGLPEGVSDMFLDEERAFGDVPMYRLGVWRVLARASAGTPQQAQWVGKLRSVAMDPATQDRIGAVESLAKLKYILAADERPVIENLAASDDDGMALFSTWLISRIPGSVNPQDRVASYLTSTDPITRLRAIYILRFLTNLTSTNRGKLKAAAQAEPKDTLPYTYATSSSYIVARAYGDASEARRSHDELRRIAATREPGAEKQEACRALGDQGSHADLDVIAPLMTNPAPAARVGAALAAATITRRDHASASQKSSLSPE